MWRAARPEDDAAIVELFIELNREDPGQKPVAPEQMRRTLEVLRAEPWRGRLAVLDLGGAPAGYALLISFWSNELGGELCQIDELYVAAAHRSRGHGTALFEAVADGRLWPGPLVALALGVTPANARARAFYERLGFSAIGTSLVRRLNG
jgi:ribosomal protein S18 acetylase RimI-like enzyme